MDKVEARKRAELIAEALGQPRNHPGTDRLARDLERVEDEDDGDRFNEDFYGHD